MRQSFLLAALAPVLAIASPVAAQEPAGDPIARAVASPDRTPANIARDRYRHPAETLAFFGVRPTDTVVEIWPGGGWYAEILAPLVAHSGQYWAVAPVPNGLRGIEALRAAAPERYTHVRTAAFPAGDGEAGVPDGTADKLLTFRNVHNWRFGGEDRAAAAFAQMFAMLKPGGVLGVVEHRLPEDRDPAAEEKSGYLKESTVIALATRAGFRLDARSDVNANPRDTADWPEGVWTLPPTLRLKEVDRAKYQAIGESDRMTLRFVKPE